MVIGVLFRRLDAKFKRAAHLKRTLMAIHSSIQANSGRVSHVRTSVAQRSVFCLFLTTAASKVLFIGQVGIP